MDHSIPPYSHEKSACTKPHSEPPESSSPEKMLSEVERILHPDSDPQDPGMKNGSKKSMGKKLAHMMREYLEIAGWGLPIFLFFTTYLAQNFKIPTQSMENTLLIGDHITVNKFIFGSDQVGLDKYAPIRKLKRGDVVVFKWPGNTRQYWIKRLIGLPGETIKIHNDHIVLNGARQAESYAYYKGPYRQGSGRDPEKAFRPIDYYSLEAGLDKAVQRNYQFQTLKKILENTRYTLANHFAASSPRTYRRLVARLESGDGTQIPPGFYYVMGDNRNRSMDSRAWGLVPRELITGRAYWRWWSYGEDEGTHNLRGFDFIKIYLRYPITFWTRTHWQESMSPIK